MTIENAQYYREQVKALLEAENLPVTDLPKNLNNFVVARVNGEIVGVAGLEVYGGYGLLRSVTVKPSHRGWGIAGKLIDDIVSLGSLKRLSALYLLTETAPDYFKNKGFTQIGREQVPAKVKGSSQFSHVCPLSAIVMKKIIS
jgi:amino-acid N-acetyltransferase